MESVKIPVFRSLGAGFGFVLLRIFGILRASLLPIAISVAAFVAAFVLIFPNGIDPASPPKPEDLQNIGYILPLYLVVGAASLMLFAGITKVYFKEPIGLLYIRFGAAELRLLIASIIVFLIIAIVCGGPMIGLLVALGGMADPTAVSQTTDTVGGLPFSQTQFAIISVAGLLLFFVYLFLAFRFGLITPVVVNEKRIGVGRSWTLMRGNVWRLFFLMLLVLILAGAIIAGVDVGLRGTALGSFDAQFNTALVNGNIDAAMFATPLGAAYIALQLGYYLFIYGLFIGATSYAYQTLADGGESVDEPVISEPIEEPVSSEAPSAEAVPEEETPKRSSRRRRR